MKVGDKVVFVGFKWTEADIKYRPDLIKESRERFPVGCICEITFISECEGEKYPIVIEHIFAMRVSRNEIKPCERLLFEIK